MGFIKRNWGYILLVFLIAAVAGAVWYLFVLLKGGEPYAGGMLVKSNLDSCARAVMDWAGGRTV